jgi:hypothetical protein
MDKIVKIAILTVATGGYKSLLIDLIESINEKFLTSYNKDIFVFSDENIYSNCNANIIFSKINHEKWPLVSLKRYEYFINSQKELLEYDYIFYFDCDLQVVKAVDEFEFHDLFAVSHPAKLFNDDMWDIETNPISTAYLDPNNIGHYVQGCFWGGRPSEIIKMVTQLKKNAEIDLEKNFIAKWFDESHLNKYFFDNKNIVSQVSSSYSYPENWNLPIEKFIIHRDKDTTKLR